MYCKKCGGRMEGSEDGDTWRCDTCGRVVGEGADDPWFGNEEDEEDEENEENEEIKENKDG